MQLEVPRFPPTAGSTDRLGLILPQSQIPSPAPWPSKEKDAGGGSSGQGFIADVPTKNAVEAAAMAAAKKHYGDQKWVVEDVSARKVGYDLLCKRPDGALLCVEVKGTTQAPKSVLVSPNEVSFALVNPDTATLFVLSNIKIQTTADGAPVATGGTATWLEPWTVESERLSPTGYNYAIDGLT